MSTTVTIRRDIKLGTWQGMGGAITEASAYNFAKLSLEKQQQLLDAYYGKDGLDYRWCRLSIGSNDFCLGSFEYTKRNSLRDFSIEHDRKWILPMAHQALEKQPALQIIASPWSPPKCMKITHMLRYGGALKPWRYGNYARYIHKWLESYAAEGVQVRYLSPQNEPRAIQIWESCMYSFRAQRKLAYKYLAPALADLNVQLLLWDHNKKTLAKVADQLFSGSYVTTYGAKEKVAGLCYHWYNGTHADQMWQVRQKYPDILMVSSEMCCGNPYPYDEQDWRNAGALYYRELLSDINTGSCAWVDWNMLLSHRGGPSYCHNFVKSPVILNEAEDDFVLTPIYQALKKFAKLFPVGSQVVRCEFESDDIVAVARKMKKGCAAVVANISDKQQEAVIKLGNKTKTITLQKHEIKCVNIQ